MHQFCPQCSTPVAPGVAQCPTCGHVLWSSGDPTAQVPPVGPPPGGVPPSVTPAAPVPAPAPTPAPRQGPNTALIVAVSVLATAVVGLGIALFLTRDDGGGSASSTTTTPPPASSTTAPPTTAPPTTAPPTTAPPTTAPPSTAPPSTQLPAGQTLGDVRNQPAGLFCRDLEAKGYSYAAAVDYWYFHGQPDQMDADRNGIPCETVYSRRAVGAYWGVNDIPRYDTVPAGLLCRDLAARGFSYADSVAYWFATGSPTNMDADKNGIPCETVYSAGEVDAYWG